MFSKVLKSFSYMQEKFNLFFSLAYYFSFALQSSERFLIFQNIFSIYFCRLFGNTILIYFCLVSC